MNALRFAGRFVILPVLLLFSVSIVVAQEPSPPQTTAEQAKVFVFAQRTDRHGKYSSSEVFHNAMDDLMAHLKEKNVVIAVDEFGGRNYAESATPMDTVLKIARAMPVLTACYM
ncbi:MAG: hypothetical protein WBL63_26405 [Candidatus Acidiferrum sp.]